MDVINWAESCNIIEAIPTRIMAGIRPSGTKLSNKGCWRSSATALAITGRIPTVNNKLIIVQRFCIRTLTNRAFVNLV